MKFHHPPLTPWKYGEPMDAWLYPHVADKLAELIEKHQIRTVLEIGTCYGCSAIWFAERGCHVTCIDLWPDIPEHGLIDTAAAFIANVTNADKWASIKACKGDSHNPNRAYILGLIAKYDLVYLDGDHTYEGVKQDIAMYGPLARKVLAGDDYDIEVPSVAGVIRAVDELVPDRQTHGRLWFKENA